MIAIIIFLVSLILRYISLKRIFKKLVFEILGQGSEEILQKFSVFLYSPYIIKKMVSCQAATFASDSGLFTEKIFDQKVELALISHKKKMEWRSEHEKN